MEALRSSSSGRDATGLLGRDPQPTCKRGRDRWDTRHLAEERRHLADGETERRLLNVRARCSCPARRTASTAARISPWPAAALPRRPRRPLFHPQPCDRDLCGVDRPGYFGHAVRACHRPVLLAPVSSLTGQPVTVRAVWQWNASIHLRLKSTYMQCMHTEQLGWKFPVFLLSSGLGFKPIQARSGGTQRPRRAPNRILPTVYNGTVIIGCRRASVSCHDILNYSREHATRHSYSAIQLDQKSLKIRSTTDTVA